MQTSDVAEITVRVNQIKSALNEGLSAIFALWITDSLKTLSGPWKEQDYELWSDTNPCTVIHLMVIRGYDNAAKKILVENSWGTDMGDGGYYGLPFNAAGEKNFEAWIVREFAGYEIPAVPGIKHEPKTVNDNYRVEARIDPRPEDIGKEVKIWIGRIHNGVAFLRKPIDLDMLAPTSIRHGEGLDKWGRYRDGDPLIPTVEWLHSESRQPDTPGPLEYYE